MNHQPCFPKTGGSGEFKLGSLTPGSSWGGRQQICPKGYQGAVIFANAQDRWVSILENAEISGIFLQSPNILLLLPLLLLSLLFTDFLVAEERESGQALSPLRGTWHRQRCTVRVKAQTSFHASSSLHQVGQGGEERAEPLRHLARLPGLLLVARGWWKGVAFPLDHCPWESWRRDSAAVSGQLESPLAGEKDSHKTGGAWWPDSLLPWRPSTGPPGPKHSQCLWNHGQIRPRHWNSKQGIIIFKRLHESVALPALYLRLEWRCNVSSILRHFFENERGPRTKVLGEFVCMVSLAKDCRL